MEQEADVALDHLNHPVDVHHGLLIPSAQIGAHLRVEVLQLKHGCKITVMLQQRTKITIAIIVVVVFFTSGVCRLLWRPWTYLSSSNRNVCQVKEETTQYNTLIEKNDDEDERMSFQ